MEDVMRNPRAEAFVGVFQASQSYGISYTNPFGNYTVVDFVPEDLLTFVSSHWYGFPPLNELWYGILAFCVAVIGVLALSGNAVVIYVFLSTSSLRTPSNYFLINLAVSDLLLMGCMAPTMLVNSYYKTWAFGPFFCKVFGGLGTLAGTTSILTMCFITYDRYALIVKDITSESLSAPKAALQILLLWLLSVAWTLAPFFGWGSYVPEGNMTVCGFNYLSLDLMNTSYLWAFISFSYFGTLVFLTYCYWFIVSSAHHHEKGMREQAQKMGVESIRGDFNARKRSFDWKVARVSLVTTLFWYVAWTPYVVVIIAGLTNRSLVTPLLASWCSVLAKATTAYNPVVYAVCHPKYKAALYQKLPCLRCSENAEPEHGPGSGTTDAATDEKV
ncbi:rhodopsin-like [Oratosquilla oratoria]|uniref:rhodopsin-like n=1 Tax=Oratosquilla oratoria TaxID=337810 RepID=UPI003F769F29